MITQKELKELLNYDPYTGIFTWAKSKGTAKIGKEAGWICNQRGKTYKSIMINGKSYYAHRLAWFYMYGHFPEKDVDHINGNGLDNRIINLRSVTESENLRNSRKSILNTSGFCGVYFHKPTGKWQAKIQINGKGKSLGLFFDKNEALLARKSAEQLHGFHEFHGSEREFKL